MTSKKTAKNDWALLHIRASMLYYMHKESAPVRTERFWKIYTEAKRKNDIQDAFLTTEAFRLTFTRKV